MYAGLHIWNLAAAILWLALLSWRLKHVYDKQDNGSLALFFIAGVLSMPLLYVLAFFNPVRFLIPQIYENRFAYYILVAAPQEEIAKFAVFAAVAVSLSLLKEPQDGVIQGAIVGVVFGAIENIGYIETYGASAAFRPIISTGGHAIYTALTAGVFSQAVYARKETTDSYIWQRAILGILAVGLVHGLYNSVLAIRVPGVGTILSYALDFAALGASLALFSRLVELSPYRVYPLSQSSHAIGRLKRGLDFNPGSTLLNRNLGFYLMHEGSYRSAAMHLRASIPRARDPRRARFFAAVCDMSYVPEARALRTLRSTWSSLSDEQRDNYMRQLRRLLESDPEMLDTVTDWITRNFRKDFIPRAARTV